MNNIKEESTKLTYDDRRKILHQKKSQITENIKDAVENEKGKITEEAKLISTMTKSMDVEYTEEGIRLAHKNLVDQKTFMKERSALLLKQFSEAKEMPEELKEFKKKIAEIVKYDAIEKAKLEYEDIQKNLKNTSKELKELTDEIGTRLKF